MRRVRSLLLFALTVLTPGIMASSAASAQAFLAQTSLAQLYVEQTSPVAALASEGPQALSDEELSGLRGGFLTTNGFTFGFGVVIRSYVDDRLALETRMTWTPTGPVTQQTRGDVPGMTDLASALTSLLNSGIDLRNLGGTSGGVALVGGDGATALIHNVTSGQLQNLIVNSASNRDLRQDMELNLYLPDLAAMQAASSAHARAAQLTYDLNTSLVGSLGR
ncbi:hypothetical protein D3C80_1064970 [compost metagenome]